MASTLRNSKKSQKSKKSANVERADKIGSEIEQLEFRILEEAPAFGTNPLAFEENSNESATNRVAYPKACLFSSFPLSKKTQEALVKENYTKLTDIQRAAIPHALCGRDILGAAKTGSGKTLAFCVPLVEKLYRARWTSLDGLGALIISPTRELSVQIFDVLRRVGANHDLSAGLIIGGKSFEQEAKFILTMNVLVCTPGRLLQHMDQTATFTCDNLQILVLDEADRILDLGFEESINAILQNLPPRQTLLFSATQTKSVKQLAKLSLQNPQYLSVHDEEAEATPSQLMQTYMFCEAHEKMDVLFSFIKTHLKSKCIVFLSSCKQVRYMYQMYKRMHPGVLLTEIHGKMKQSKRMATYYDFISQPAAILFATDLAARGLDFPSVDWVVQYDCPDSVASYIHRAGRTARYKSSGNGLLLLLPSEKNFINLLEQSKIPLKKVKANPNKLQSVCTKFAGYLAENAELKYLAQKAFVTYMKSIFLQSDKTVFDVSGIDAEKLSNAMGLPGTPKMKFIKGSSIKKNMPAALREMMEEDDLKKTVQENSDAEESLKKIQADKRRKKLISAGELDPQTNRITKLLKRKSSTVYAESRLKIRDESDSEQDDLFQVKRKDHPIEVVQVRETEDSQDSKVAPTISKIDKEKHLLQLKKKLSSADIEDKVTEHQRVKALHLEKRLAQRNMRRQKDDSDDDDSVSQEYSDESENYSDEDEESELDDVSESEQSEDEQRNQKKAKIDTSLLEEQAKLVLKSRNKK